DRAEPQDGSGAEGRGSGGRIVVLPHRRTRLLRPGPSNRILSATAGIPRPEHRAVARTGAGRGRVGGPRSAYRGGRGKQPERDDPSWRDTAHGCFTTAGSIA